MTDILFEYTDEDGDRVEVEKSWREGCDLVVNAYANDGDVASFFLPPAEVTRLRAALAPYDPEYLAQTEYRQGFAAGKAEAAEEAQERAREIEVGREYRLLPDAHNVGVKSAINGHGATRVRVVKGPDQGDYRVEALDGDIAGQDWYWVAARYLAPLEPALVDYARYRQGYNSGFADGQAGLAEAKQDAYEQGKREGASAQLDARREGAVRLADELLAEFTNVTPYDQYRLARFLFGEEV